MFDWSTASMTFEICLNGILLLANLVVIIRGFRMNHKDGRQILFLQIGVICFLVSTIFEIISTGKYLSYENEILESLDQPMKAYGWLVTEAVFGTFLCSFIQTMIEIKLTFAYLGSYYRLKKLLNGGKKTEIPRIWNIIKWILITVLFISCAVTSTFQILLSKIIFSGQQHILSTETSLYLNIASFGYASIFVVLLTVNFIFLSTIIAMWNSMRHHAYLRRNECSMILRFVFNFMFALSQLVGVIGIVIALHASLNTTTTTYKKMFKEVQMLVIIDGVNAFGSFTVYGLLTYYLAWLVRLDESRFRGEDGRRPFRRGASGVDN